MPILRGGERGDNRDMQVSKFAFKVLLAIGIALPPAASAQFSRWVKTTRLDSVMPYGLMVSPDGSTMLANRYDLDPIRSFVGGATWAPFNINGQRPTSYTQIAPTDPATWYAVGATDGALYMSPDRGTTWTRRSEHSGIVSISADPQVIYQAFSQDDPNCDFNECPITHTTLQVSSDGGLHWRDLRSVSGPLTVYPSPVDRSLVIAIGPDGLTRSRDMGATWSPIGPALPAASSYGRILFDRVDAGVLYLVPTSMDDTRIYASTDAGTTWSSATAQGGLPVADPVQAGRAYLFSYTGAAYETRDAGASWARVEPTVPDDSPIEGSVSGVVLHGGMRFAVKSWDYTLRQLDLNNGALALTSDLWWNPAQSGWGMSITHHSSTQTFVAWFTYDRNGDAVWRIIPGGQWNDRTFTGDIYQTTGPPFFGAPFDTNGVVTTRVGSGKIVFDDDNDATFSWRLDEGLSGSVSIVREEFGVPVTPQVVYANYADLWWNAAESGWGISISHQYDNIFAAWYVYDPEGNPLWVVMPDAKVRVDSQGALPKATGVLYATHGPSASLPFFDPSRVTLTPVGSATLTFSSTGQAQLDYTAYGHTDRKAIVRQPF